MRWKTVVPSEHSIQEALFQWADSVRYSIPEAALMFAIPNGGMRPKKSIFKRGKIVTFSPEAKKLKAEGVKKGVPDIFLPVARHGFNGLFIEMKRPGETPTAEQEFWHKVLRDQGYAVVVYDSLEDAICNISGYLKEGVWYPNIATQIIIGKTIRTRIDEPAFRM